MADLLNKVQEKNERTIGPIISSIIILIIIILAGLYLWGQKLNHDAKVRKANEAASASTTEMNDIESIKVDLNETNVKAIEAKINKI